MASGAVSGATSQRRRYEPNLGGRRGGRGLTGALGGVRRATDDPLREHRRCGSRRRSLVPRLLAGTRLDVQAITGLEIGELGGTAAPELRLLVDHQRERFADE